MRSLITGASGFVGSAVVRQLLDAGHQVRALLRPHSDRRNLSQLDVELCEGDLTDKNSLRCAVSDCDYLFHVAADYRLWIPEPDTIYRINVQGTQDLIQCAVAAGIKKIVYTSSVAALGLNSDATPAHEETPVTLENMIGHYKRSKFLAEQKVHELVKTIQAPVIIVNPSTPVGPRDIKPTPTGRIFVDTLRKRMPAYVNTGLNIVHVEDVARGHLLALERGEIGARYILGGENMSLYEILVQICEIAGLTPPRFRIPHDMILPIAHMAEAWARITGADPFVTVDEIRMAKKFMYFSSHKAQEKLGYRPRPAREGIADAIDWFKENNYC